MMKKSRQLHLWIGLIASILILIESITGLLMSEPWLIGMKTQEKGRMAIQTQAGGMRPAQAYGEQTQGQQSGGVQTAEGDASQKATQPSAIGPRDAVQFQGAASMNWIGIIKGLHQGRLPNGASVKWLVDLTAVSMIILTSTGVVLSFRVLRSQRLSRKKAAAAARTKGAL